MEELEIWKVVNLIRTFGWIRVQNPRGFAMVFPKFWIEIIRGVHDVLNNSKRVFYFRVLLHFLKNFPKGSLFIAPFLPPCASMYVDEVEEAFKKKKNMKKKKKMKKKKNSKFGKETKSYLTARRKHSFYNSKRWTVPKLKDK